MRSVLATLLVSLLAAAPSATLRPTTEVPEWFAVSANAAGDVDRDGRTEVVEVDRRSGQIAVCAWSNAAPYATPRVTFTPPVRDGYDLRITGSMWWSFPRSGAKRPARY